MKLYALVPTLLAKLSGVVLALLLMTLPNFGCDVADEPIKMEVTVDTESRKNRLKWEKSAHAAENDMAFKYWHFLGHKEYTPGCEHCHTETGYLDFLGVDGSTVGVVDKSVPVNYPPEVIGCTTCHRNGVESLDTVVLPSGFVLTGLGKEARCLICHVGFTSSASIQELIQGVDEDTVIQDLVFIGLTGLHPSGAAGSIVYGNAAGGPYEYGGKTYAGRYDHDHNGACTACHDTHSLKVDVEYCASCHEGVGRSGDIQSIRTTLIDFDGDDDIEEGVGKEISDLGQILYRQMQMYAAETAGASHIIFDKIVYPYYFVDLNQDGESSTDETDFFGSNAYNTWTPRLAKAAFNYKYLIDNLDGAASHNYQYMIQILIDSIEDLGGDITRMARP